MKLLPMQVSSSYCYLLDSNILLRMYYICYSRRMPRKFMSTTTQIYILSFSFLDIWKTKNVELNGIRHLINYYAPKSSRK